LPEAKPLQGRVALVTGASQGLGRAVALAYAAAGAKVAICARNEAPLRETQGELAAQTGTQGCFAAVADVSVEEQANAVVAETLRQFARIDILVNNAAIHGPKGQIEEIDWHDWKAAVEVNLLGSVLMARAVVPSMKRQRYGKIIQLSGGGGASPRYGFSAYAASKAAAVRFAENLALELEAHHIDVNSVAPGALNTRLLQDTLAAGPSRIGEAAFAAARRQLSDGGTALDVPVRLAVFLASGASDGITGKLISAAWDNWEQFPSHRDELRKSDVYTLRRIVGKDRGADWGDK